MSTLSVRPVAGHIGADIDGVDLARPLATETIEGIKQALHRHKVVFFRGQQLDHSSQIAFACHFGELTYARPHDDAPLNVPRSPQGPCWCRPVLPRTARPSPPGGRRRCSPCSRPSRRLRLSTPT
ncbi:TauD/TfdA dioxygenase family protein [Streptomyces wedmorensis]|uniref:TauD/TfdA dioxygenase family protein n=1 Tax=Streptomyces wedmorensis TaxID=43759 RepID=UPI003F4D4676